MPSRWTPGGITPALTERRERFEFASGVDGKIGEANPDARCRFGSTHCYPDGLHRDIVLLKFNNDHPIAPSGRHRDHFSVDNIGASELHHDVRWFIIRNLTVACML